MNINFKKIKMHNFMSIGDGEISLDNAGFVSIKGINENPTDSAESNGSGKTSIFEALCWVITGNTMRGISQVTNIHSDSGCVVELDFSCDNAVYKIIRAKDSKEYGTNLKIYINGEDKSGKGIRDSAKLLSQYLPDLNNQLIGSVIVLGQGLPQRFTNNTPAGRKEVLEKLSKSDYMIESLKDKISMRKSYLQSKLRETEDLILSIKSELQVYEKNLYNTQSQLQSLRDIDELENRIKEYEQSIADNSVIIDEYNDNLNTITEEINSTNVELNNIKEERYKAESQSIKNKNESLNPLKERLSQVNANIVSLTREIKRLSEIKDVCPTCGQKLPNVVKPNTDSQKEELEKLKSEYDIITQQITDSSNQMDASWNSEKLRYDSKYDSLFTKATSLNVELNKINSALSIHESRMNNDRASLAVAQSQLKDFYGRKEELENYCDNIVQDINKLNDDLLYNNNEKTRINDRISIILKFETAVKRDFRGYLLINVIEYINKSAKRYSKLVFGTDKIEFALNDNNIDISYDNKIYESLSGGEQQKVNLIIQFALRDMLCEYLHFSSNILVVDECFDNLDYTGCQRIIDLISSLKDISSIFIITHQSSLNIPYDNSIIVRKDSSGISKIENDISKTV